MKGNNFLFDCVDLFYCKCHIYLNGIGPYINYPKGIKIIKATINKKAMIICVCRMQLQSWKYWKRSTKNNKYLISFVTYAIIES